MSEEHGQEARGARQEPEGGEPTVTVERPLSPSQVGSSEVEGRSEGRSGGVGDPSEVGSNGMGRRSGEASAVRLGPLTRGVLRIAGVESQGNDEEIRSTYATVEGWVSITVNTVLFVLKIVLGFISGSIALMADAAHTFADSLTSVIVIISAKAARRPPDEEHPFGHERVEAIATVVCAVLIGVAGLEFVKASAVRLWEGERVDASWGLVAVVAATMVVKEWLARFARTLGRLSGNTTLEAEFWHHRSDVFATAVVVVGMLGGRIGLPWLDAVMGAVVGALLVKVAYDVARGAVDHLIGRAPSREELEELRSLALGIEGVTGVHDIVVHHYGQVRFVSLHIETSHELAAEELHALSEKVETRLSRGRHGSVCVHVDPVNREHPAWNEVNSLVARLVDSDREVDSYHDLRIVGDERSFTVIFDVNRRVGSREDDHETRRRLGRAVQEASGATKVVVKVDPPYSYQR